MIALVSLLLLGVAPPTFDENAVALRATAVLARHCLRCHNAETTRGGLDLSTREALLLGGATSDAVASGDPAESPLFQRASAGTMPPEKDGRRLNAEELAALQQWIARDVPWPSSKELRQFPVRPPSVRYIPSGPFAAGPPSRNILVRRGRRFRR